MVGKDSSKRISDSASINESSQAAHRSRTAIISVKTTTTYLELLMMSKEV